MTFRHVGDILTLVAKKLKHGFIITGCWNSHWSVHMLKQQAHTSVDSSQGCLQVPFGENTRKLGKPGETGKICKYPLKRKLTWGNIN